MFIQRSQLWQISQGSAKPSPDVSFPSVTLVFTCRGQLDLARARARALSLVRRPSLGKAAVCQRQQLTMIQRDTPLSDSTTLHASARA